MKLKITLISLIILLHMGLYAQNVVTNISAGSDLYPILKSAKNNTIYKLERGKYYIDEKYGKGLEMNDVKSVIIRGEEGVSIIAKNGYMNVLTIRGGNDIKLENLYMTHDVDRGDCDAPVLNLDNCNNVIVYNSTLDGSGTLAAQIVNSSFIDFLGGEASHNTEGVFNFSDSDHIDIRKMKISDNTNINWGNTTEEYFGMGVLNLTNCSVINFQRNTVANNSNKYFLKAQTSYDIKFEFNTYSGNSFSVSDSGLSKQRLASGNYDYCFELEEGGGVQIVKIKIESNGNATGEIVYAGQHGSEREGFVGTFKDNKLKVEAITELEVHNYEFFFNYSELKKGNEVYTKVACK